MIDLDNQLKLLCSNIDDLKILRDQVTNLFGKQSTASSLSTINSNTETTGDKLNQLINSDGNQGIDSLIGQMKEAILNGRSYFQTLYNQPEQSIEIKTLLQSHSKVLNDLESFVNSIESNNLVNTSQQSIDYPIRPLSPEIIIEYGNDDKSSTTISLQSRSSSLTSIIYLDQSNSSLSTQSSPQLTTNLETIKTNNNQLNCHSPSTSIGSSIYYDYKYNNRPSTAINFTNNSLITWQQLTQLFDNLMSNKLIQILIGSLFILLLILINS